MKRSSSARYVTEGSCFNPALGAYAAEASGESETAYGGRRSGGAASPAQSRAAARERVPPRAQAKRTALVGRISIRRCEVHGPHNGGSRSALRQPKPARSAALGGRRSGGAASPAQSRAAARERVPPRAQAKRTALAGRISIRPPTAKFDVGRGSQRPGSIRLRVLSRSKT